MTRISRWIRILDWWQLKTRVRGGVLLRLWWLLQAWMHQGWFLPVCSRPSLWVDRQWLEWSRNCLPSNRLIPVDQSQSLSKGSFISALVRATIEDDHRACDTLLWRLNKHHRLSHRPWRCDRVLASSIFGQTIWKSSQCQNSRPEDCHSNG